MGALKNWMSCFASWSTRKIVTAWSSAGIYSIEAQTQLVLSGVLGNSELSPLWATTKRNMFAGQNGRQRSGQDQLRRTQCGRSRKNDAPNTTH